MKEMIEANLKPKAIENTNAPKKPDIVLFICNWLYVRGNGSYIKVIEMLLLCIKFMYVYAAKVCKYKQDVGIRVFTIDVKPNNVLPFVAVAEALKNIPPIKNLIDYFLGFRKFKSKSVAKVELVSI